MHVDAATGVGAVDDSGLAQDEIEGIAPACADDGQIADHFAREQIAEVARGGGLHGFGDRFHFDRLGDVADFEADVNGGWRADGDGVAFGGEFLEAGRFHCEGVGAGLHGFKAVGAGVGGGGGEGGVGTFVDETYGGSGDDGAGGILDSSQRFGSSALPVHRCYGKTQRKEEQSTPLRHNFEGNMPGDRLQIPTPAADM